MPGKTISLAHWHDLLLQGIFQGILIGAVSIVVYTRAVALLGVIKVSFFTAAVPGLATLGGFFLLNEVPSLATLAGVALTTLGMLIAFRGSF